MHGALPRAAGYAAQALVLDVLRQHDPALAAQLHDPHERPPVTIAVVPPTTRTATTLDVRVTLLQADLAVRVLAALDQQAARPQMRLGSTALGLVDVIGTPGQHPWAGFTSSATLAQQARPARTITLDFVTPTAWNVNRLPDGRKRYLVLPTPEAVFNGLAWRWERVTSVPLPVRASDVSALAVTHACATHYSLETRVVDLGKGGQRAFVGWCTYALSDDPTVQHTFSLLADAAFYLGAGMKTARGMGLCRRRQDVATAANSL